MPLFEFICSDCGNSFEVLVRMSSASTDIACPSCSGKQVKKKVSTFASKTSIGSSFSSASSAASCSPAGT